MRPLSDSTLSEISNIIAISPQYFGVTTGTPGRPVGLYRTYDQILWLLSKVDPLIPRTQEEAAKYLSCITRSQATQYDRKSFVYFMIKTWNEHSQDSLKILIINLIDPTGYPRGSESELMRVYGALNTVLQQDGFILGGFPIDIIESRNLSAQEKLDMQWQSIWFLASKTLCTERDLRNEIQVPLLLGQFNDVVRKSVEIVFHKLQRKVGVSDVDGEALITIALRGHAHVLAYTKYSDPGIEDRARKMIASKFSMLYQSYRNPSSHHFSVDNPWESILAIWNSDWCLKELNKLDKIRDYEPIPPADSVQGE